MGRFEMSGLDNIQASCKAFGKEQRKSHIASQIPSFQFRGLRKGSLKSEDHPWR